MSRFFDLCATACGVLIAAYLTYALGELTWLSYVRDSRSPEKSELLRWIVQFPMFVGALQFTLQPWPGWHGCCGASRVTTFVCVSARTSNNS